MIALPPVTELPTEEDLFALGACLSSARSRWERWGSYKWFSSDARLSQAGGMWLLVCFLFLELLGYLKPDARHLRGWITAASMPGALLFAMGATDTVDPVRKRRGAKRWVKAHGGNVPLLIRAALSDQSESPKVLRKTARGYLDFFHPDWRKRLAWPEQAV